ncbi:hypothetical protein SDC9_42384 [bioreactor metagenome]|uniref:Uncharacterized protein n=1 Tax=bioreactor metagenome TaxID=1076179 RepID=A0A644VXR6_9ZZZZ
MRSFRSPQVDSGIDQGIDDVHDKVDQDEHGRHDHEIGHDDGPVRGVDGVHQELAHPRPGEDGLRHGGEGDKAADLHAEHRHHGNEGVLQRMGEEEAPPGDPLGPGEPDEVLSHHFHDLGPDEPNEHGQRSEGEGHRREDDVPEPVPREEGEGDAEEGSRGSPARRGQESLLHGEVEDEQNAHPEGRQGNAQQRPAHDRPAERAVRPRPGVDPAGQGHRQGQEHREEDQFEGGGHPLHDEGQGGALEDVGHPQVTPDEVLQEDPVLHPQGPVEAEGCPGLGDLGIRGRGRHDHEDRVAGEAHHEKNDHRDGEQDDNHLDKAFQQIFQHGSYPRFVWNGEHRLEQQAYRQRERCRAQRQGRETDRDVGFRRSCHG